MLPEGSKPIQAWRHPCQGSNERATPRQRSAGGKHATLVAQAASR